MSRDKLIGRMVVILAIGLCCCLPSTVVIGNLGREVADGYAYDNKLRTRGIEPTLEGVENYIWQSVQPGQLRDQMLERLSVVGNVSVSKWDTCDGIGIGLYHTPGQPFHVPVPPDSHPVYRLRVCYSDDGVIDEIVSFDMIWWETYHPDVRPTVEARMTATP